eukprot:gnl/MRDRNA2_/MRDRNA2_88081_c0_seq1.p1 gnl/MRDRNA2_/MRDRNA2_88081_c0~~gnl/MRDRNA2_/MRDRNA2_88081_c0_seq1.p1  ORF type:complete len:273 (-),score=88.38 gnl/MRDRNA2_/MRDRNA2_88081_c0_seq1:106-924(-)
MGKKKKAEEKVEEKEPDPDAEEEDAPEKPAKEASKKEGGGYAPSNPPVAAKEKKEEDNDDGDGDEKADKAAKGDEEPPKPVEKPVVPFRPHTDYPPITGPIEMDKYCPHDGLPPDYCIHGPCWEKSKPWCLEHYPQYYPEFSGVSLEDAKKDAQEATEKGKVKELPGGKKKRELSPRITVKKLTRGGRKCVTVVAGLDTFQVELEKAAKMFKKRFACGASVVKGQPPAGDEVEIQGDFEEELVDLLTDNFKQIPEDKIFFAEGGTKKGGKKK